MHENVPLIKPEHLSFLGELGFKILAPTKERMFAFADVDRNGAIEIDELVSDPRVDCTGPILQK